MKDMNVPPKTHLSRLSLMLVAAAICLGLGSIQAAWAQAAPDPATPPVQEVPQAVQLVERYSMEDVSAEVTRRLLGLPGVRGVERIDGAANALRLATHAEVSVRLDTLHARLNLAEVDPETELSRFVGNVGALLARNDPFKLEQLRVVIRPTAAINAFELQTATGGQANRVVRRPFTEGLEEVVVGDTPTTIALMPIGRLTDLNLGMAQAFDRARANTVKELAGLTWTTKDGLLEADATETYATSLLALDGIWPQIQKQVGGPLAVAVPTRTILVVGRADRARDMSRLATIAASGEGDPGQLAGKVLVRQGSVWVPR
ncbi:hypothetical protein PbB2_01557 [Candidatus Phycosocius bacilliformis]|uniref:Uncharacterized protein n=1 Tax=Candidatus Phycosocius bacilliformis TaxID=1445552 RepID=A0A2P2E9Y5_9PROT|nr:hypothetical protein [Candidatus Phycosocius bacilliformis]GBF57887.1 hypothetical protein PbB2_01557 [Candidatus Phycosocius bacilliformis]